MPVKRGRKHGLRGRNLASFAIGLPQGVMPISRKVVTRRTKRVVGYFQSLKMQCAFPWESQIERDYFYCLEFDPDVTAFSAQPGCLNLVVDGEPRKHFPDLLVQYHHGRKAFHEVKTDRDAALPENQALFDAAKLHCAQHGTDYGVITESYIRRQPRLRNCQLLMHRRLRKVDLDDDIRISSALTAGPVQFASLLRLLADRPDATGIILSMAASGRIGFPLDTELTDTTSFYQIHSL